MRDALRRFTADAMTPIGACLFLAASQRFPRLFTRLGWAEPVNWQSDPIG